MSISDTIGATEQTYKPTMLRVGEPQWCCMWGVLAAALHMRVQQCDDLVTNTNKECVLRFLLGTRFGSASAAKKMASTRPARSRSPAQRPTTACTSLSAQTWEQTQQFVRALPAAKLLELCCWRVACQL